MKDNNNNNGNVPNLRFPGFSGEWKTFKLGEVAQFSKGKGISKSDIDEDGKIECIRYGELYTHYGEVINEIKSKTNIEEKNLTFSEANDVIIPASGETQLDIATACCVIKSGIALGGDLNIIKTPNNGVFLSYYLNCKKKIDIARLSQGNSVVHLYSKQLASLNINFPSLLEQNKIANLLSIIDNRIEIQKNIIKELETLIKGFSGKLFSKELIFKDKKGNDYPKWKNKKLCEIGQIITGKTPSTSNKKLWGGDIQFVTPTDLNEENKYQVKTQRTVFKTEKLKVLPKNSIMFTCIASIGKMALSVYPCITNQQINSIIPKKEFDNEYIFYTLLKITPKIKSTQANTTLPIINKTDFSKFKIPIPCLEEQNRISSFLSKIDKKIATEKLLLEKLKEQKNYLLQNLFI